MRALSRAVSDGFVCYPVMAWTPKLGALPSQAERGLNATLTP